MAAQTLFFAAALLPDGWAHDVRITIAEGVIGAIAKGQSRTAEMGIGLTMLPAFYAHGSFGGAPPASCRGECLRARSSARAGRSASRSGSGR